MARRAVQKIALALVCALTLAMQGGISPARGQNAAPLAPPATAARGADPGGSLEERYARARRALEEQRDAEDKQRTVRDTLAAETQSLQQRLIDNAARVQGLETALADTAADLERLSAQKTSMTEEFARDRDRIARLLAVLQRLETDSPPALVLKPDDSLAAARGAMMMGAMLPPIYDQVLTLSKRVEALAATERDLRQKRNEAEKETAELANARRELAALEEQRRGETEVADKELTSLHATTEEAARQTGDLKSLIDRIAKLRGQSSPDAGMRVVTANSRGGGTLARGSLRHPVAGTMAPGDPAGPGETPGVEVEGLWFEGQAGAQAVAPTDSEVVFAGGYQNFGQVLILEIAGGYDLLLSGLSRIDVRVGDLVLAGEPVGVLPDTKNARLYLELRRNGQTVNPAPWMSADLRKAKSP